MRRGVRALLAEGSEVAISFLLAGLAEGYTKAGKGEHGLNMLVGALAPMDTTGERFREVVLHRLKSELLLIHFGGKEGAPIAQFTEAEACFHEAIDFARRQQAKSFELRAASLCRLWQAQGKGAQAHALLAEIYGWFTEGFDTADLIEAKALLEALI